MLNKTDVSNQITGLRPKVKQAAVHLAHHLTREIKKCQARKGPKAEKFHKKADTHRQEVLLLKKIKTDSVSRYALEMDFKDRDKLLNDINLPLETKVTVKLATHTSVVSHVESFRQKHPDWKSKLPHLLETLGIRAQFKKKVQKQQEKQKRKLARKQVLSDGADQDSTSKKKKSTSKIKIEEESENSSDSARDSDSQSIGDDTVPGSHNTKLKNSESDGDDCGDSDVEGVDNSVEEEEELDDDNEEEELDDDDEEEEEVGDDDEEEESEVDEEEESEVDEDDNSENEGTVLSDSDSVSVDHDNKGDIKSDASTKKDNKSVKPSKNKMNDKILKTAGSKVAEVRRFADLLEDKTCVNRKSTELNLSAYNNATSSDSIVDNEPVEEDTFFMTGENRFLKTTVVKRENGEGLESSSRKPRNFDEEANPWSTDGKKLKGNRAERRAKFLGRDLKKRKPRQMDKSREFVRPAQNDKKNGTSFSKLKFNTEKSAGGNGFNAKNGKDFPKRNGNIPNNNQPNAASETLHPSWEAKRKQKVTLDNFQGKKIKFDDD